MNDENTPAASRVSAAALLLDRAYGRALQPFDLVARVDCERLTDEQLERIVRGESLIGAANNSAH